MTKGLSVDPVPGWMLRHMEAVLGLMALAVAVLLFIGANVVAVVLMIAGQQTDPSASELRH